MAPYNSAVLHGVLGEEGFTVSSVQAQPLCAEAAQEKEGSLGVMVIWKALQM